MIVNYQKPIEFVNKCGCVVDYRELEKAIIWYSDKPVTRLKTIFKHGSYPAVSIHAEKIHVHRLLMMYWLKRRIPREEQVHHKNENKFDSTKNNLELLQQGEHQSLHNKGKKFSEEHRQKIASANKKRKGMKMKKSVRVPLVELKALLDQGHSINSIAKRFNCDWSTVKNRIEENLEILEGK